MKEAFKEKATLRVRKAISLMEKLSDLSYMEEADQAVIEELLKVKIMGTENNGK